MSTKKDKFRSKLQMSDLPGKSIDPNAPGNHQEHKMILIDDIILNPKNPRQYDTEQDKRDIARLKESIRQSGLNHNLVVYPKKTEQGFKYVLLSGHRRYLALKELHEEEPSNETYAFIRCLVDNFEAYQQEIPYELKEIYRLYESNAEARELSVKERIDAIDVYETYYKQYKKAYGGDMRTRDFVASKLGVSSRNVGNYKTVNDKLKHEGLRDAFLSGRLNLTAALEIVKLPEKEQDALYQLYADTPEELSVAAIKAFVEGKTEIVPPKKQKTEEKTDAQKDSDKTPDPNEPTIQVNYYNDVNSLLKRYANVDNFIPESQRSVYEKSIKKIDRELKKLEKLIKNNNGQYCPK